MIRTTLATVAAVLLTAVTGVAPPAGGAATAASAAACSGATGVTVVVDFNELGGGLTAACAADGAGKDASQVFTDAGYPLTYVQEDPGFTCRVSGKPADNPCARTPPATAYWSLWWSDGETGSWVYSSSGVNTLQVPDGGYLAFAWHQGSGNAGPPDANPTPHDSPEPSDEPSDGHPGDNGGNGGHSGNGGNQGDTTSDGGSSGSSAVPSTSAAPTTTAATESASESASPDRRKKRRDRDGEEPSGTATSTDALPAADEITDGPPPSDLSADSSGDDDGALSTWIGLGLAVLVLGAAGLVTVLRRRSG